MYAIINELNKTKTYIFAWQCEIEQTLLQFLLNFEKKKKKFTTKNIVQFYVKISSELHIQWNGRKETSVSMLKAGMYFRLQSKFLQFLGCTTALVLCLFVLSFYP